MITRVRGGYRIGRLVVAACGLLRATATAQALPIHELPAQAPGRVLALLLTGDGNWAELDRSVAGYMAAHGVAVIGLESRNYLTHGGPKTPDRVATDLAQLSERYLTRWNRDSLLVIGYSRGAQLAPLAIARWDAALRNRVSLLVLLGPERAANLTFHMIDLFTVKQRRDDIPLLPEVERLAGTRVLCVYGDDEKQSLCPDLASPPVRTVVLHGGHHFDGDYPALAAMILRMLAGT